MARSETTEHSPSHEAAIDQRGGERRAGMRAQRTQRTTERSLHVGMMMVLARYGWEHGPDARVWDEESRLARRAADLGVDCPWSAEHHCNDDAFVPDTLQLLTSLTALCPSVDRGTAAVIVPWHHPRRVAEQAAVLDMLHKGALVKRGQSTLPAFGTLGTFGACHVPGPLQTEGLPLCSLAQSVASAMCPSTPRS